MASSTDTSIAAMKQAQDDNARLMTASMVCNTAIQGAAATTQTVNASSVASTETVKGVANDSKAVCRAS
jgi:hypothetical protein